MSGPLEISLNEKLLFIESLLIPAFDPDNELDSSKKRKEWIATQSEEKKWGSEVALKLIETDGAVENLAEAKAAGAKVERSLERQQGKSKGNCFVSVRIVLSVLTMLCCLLRFYCFPFV